MSNESISNKVGNATNNTVGEQTLLNEATTLASHGLAYAKGVVGLGGNQPAENADDAANNKQGGQTLGGLVNEGRDLAAHTLAAAQSIIASGADATKDAAADADKKAPGYVAQARDLAASALGTAGSYVQVAEKKVNEVASTTTTNDIKAKADDVSQLVTEKTAAAAKDADAKADGALSDSVKTAEDFGKDLLDKAEAQKAEVKKA